MHRQERRRGKFLQNSKQCKEFQGVHFFMSRNTDKINKVWTEFRYKTIEARKNPFSKKFYATICHSSLKEKKKFFFTAKEPSVFFLFLWAFELLHSTGNKKEVEAFFLLSGLSFLCKITNLYFKRERKKSLFLWELASYFFLPFKKVPKLNCPLAPFNLRYFRTKNVAGMIKFQEKSWILLCSLFSAG